MLKSEELVFAALADTNRRRLLAALARNSPRTATELARGFGISRQGVMKHLDVLDRAGLVWTQIRGREKRYVFNPASLQAASGWIEAISRQWDERLGRLKELVEEE